LRRADAALELLLTRDESRAAEVADELDLLNRERRDVETRILFAAEAARAEQDGAAAYVLAGEGWHPGVVGIVASRIADRHHRPCVIIAIDSEGARGSGRSIPTFDLHAALTECGGHLRRFGGHRAAAGLEIDPERIDDFRRDLVRCAAARLSPEDLIPVEEVDAVVPGTALGLDLAEGLRALGPFGHGNPEPTLLVPAARATDLRPMGDEGQHSRFTLASAGARAQGVAFRTTPAQLARDATGPCDAAVRLELREWNGAVEARLVLSSACRARSGSVRSIRKEEDFWTVLERELSASLEDPPAPAPPAGAGRLVRDRRSEGIAGVAGELLSSGEPVLVVCAQVARRRATLEGLVAGLSRCAGRDSLPLASWSELAGDPGLAAGFPQLLALDPPPAPQPVEEMAAAAGGCEGPSFVHLAWGAPEVEFALAVAREELGLRESLADVYRGLRAAGGAEGAGLRALLEGQGRHPRLPAVCARLVRVLGELGFASFSRDAPGGPSLSVLEGPRTALECSAAYRAYAARLAVAERHLAREAARFRPAASTARPA
ncbi:MAG TPA: DHHA1 domain-containing protein, partial [Thermoleophilaceae bacterium]|nr:DHHA1 domain-containing protein [Thermoleophilaceae bacterium]